ncbi:MAG: hypothetical protein AB7G28_20870 [Pirellulales bacterium]
MTARQPIPTLTIAAATKLLLSLSFDVALAQLLDLAVTHSILDELRQASQQLPAR